MPLCTSCLGVDNKHSPDCKEDTKFMTIMQAMLTIDQQKAEMKLLREFAKNFKQNITMIQRMYEEAQVKLRGKNFLTSEEEKILSGKALNLLFMGWTKVYNELNEKNKPIFEKRIPE